MNKGIDFTLLVRLLTVGLVILALYMILDYSASITPPVTPTEHSPNTISGEITLIRLTVQAINATEAFTTVGQVIAYNYVVTNTGNSALAGPVIITDDKVIATCPAVNTVGNSNNNLDLNESITCTGTYSLTQADLNAGSVTTNTTATVGTVVSSIASTTVRMTENKVLTLTKSANPTSYSQAGQVITYTYIINNTGAPTLGPTQFIVRDDHISAPITCGAATTTLATNQTVTCTGTYTIAATDMTLAQVTNSATVSGGGAGSIQPATITITNTNVQTSPGTPSNLSRGSTIQHSVTEGEWLLQIANCYGADFEAVRTANPQVTDPNVNLPSGATLTIPNIGSNGTIYGPPCVVFYAVQDGDTWESLAQKYNADIAVLQQANGGVTFSSGIQLRIPLNSARPGVTYNPPPYPPPATPVASASETSQPLEAIYATAGAEMDALPIGQFVYNPPSSLMLNETRDFVLEISPSLSSEALATQVLSASGLPTSVAAPGMFLEPSGAVAVLRSGTVEITSKMQAVLRSDDKQAFDIQELHDDPIRDVDPNITTKWHWLVTARKSGPQRLTLVIFRQALVNDEQHWPEYETFRDEIMVNVTLAQRLGSLDWKWIIGTIVTALLIPGFWRWVDQRKKQTESISTPKPAKKKAKKPAAR